MALTKFGFIVASSEIGPVPKRVVMSSSQFEMVAIGVSNPSQGLPVAKAMVEEGIQLIELCGAFGPVWTAKIIEAIEERIPVGFVAYGPEAISPMHRLFE